MVRGMAVSGGFSPLQRVLDHCAAQEHRGQRVLCVQRLCGVGQRGVVIAVQLIGARQHDPCNPVKSGPGDEEMDRLT